MKQNSWEIRIGTIPYTFIDCDVLEQVISNSLERQREVQFSQEAAGWALDDISMSTIFHMAVYKVFYYNLAYPKLFSPKS